MDNDTREDGLTFGEICRMILRRIWYVLGMTAVVTIVALLIVYFAVNPAQRKYSMEFDLVFPTGSESVYPDGEPFFYQNMISASALTDVVKTEGLGKINIDKMIRDDDIEILAVEDEDDLLPQRYAVKAKSAYFEDDEQAEAFFRAVAQVTVDKIRAEAGSVDYAVSEETFGQATFAERLNFLAEERKTLLGKYDEWIKTYDAAYKLKVGETEKSLKEFRASVNALYGESVQKELETELETGGYYYTADFDAYTKALRKEYNRNETEIEKLKEAGGTVAASLAGGSAPSGIADSLASVSTSPARNEEGGSIIVEQPAPSVSQRLAELIERNANILQWLGADYLADSDGGSVAVSGTLTAGKNDAFAQKLDGERIKLAGAAAELTAVTKAIYERGMQARFNMQKAETEGGVSILLVAVIAAVLSFAAASFAVCAIEKSRAGKTAAAADAGASSAGAGASSADAEEGAKGADGTPKCADGGAKREETAPADAPASPAETAQTPEEK